MSTIVFVGPTLRREDMAPSYGFTWRGPAAQGDVYRASLEAPEAIAVIDGYFETVPSVWHKEILWALSRGVRVYGAASMGALRAAELSAFGMIGVGEVFESFADGTLEDDDEVAVLHGPADDGYRSLSDAMVNVRATLRRAVGEGVISQPTAEELTARAKARFYQERSLLRVALEAADLEGGTALRSWMTAGRVDQKRRDALALLARLDADRHAPRHDATFTFEHTDAWEAMRRAPHAL